MMLVLDTHIWLWWMSSADQLKPEWKKHIELAPKVGVSAISLSADGKFKLYQELNNLLVS